MYNGNANSQQTIAITMRLKINNARRDILTNSSEQAAAISKIGSAFVITLNSNVSTVSEMIVSDVYACGTAARSQA